MLLFVLRVFWEASATRRFHHNLWICSISEQIHGTVHSEELPFRSQGLTYFSWPTFHPLTGLSVTTGIAGHSAVGPSCSCSSHSPDAIHFAFISSIDERSIISPLQCMGLQFVLLLHHGSFRFHFTQRWEHAVAHHPH